MALSPVRRRRFCGLQLQVDEGGDPSAVDTRGRTPVHLAALAAIVISGGELDHAATGCHDPGCLTASLDPQPMPAALLPSALTLKPLVPGPGPWPLPWPWLWP